MLLDDDVADRIEHVADVAGVGGAREVLVDLFVGVLVHALEHLQTNRK